MIHLRNDGPFWKSVWGEIGRQPDIKIVYITRANKLAKLVSNKNAKSTNVWQEYSESQKPAERTVHVTRGMLLDAIEDEQKERLILRTMYQTHAIIDVNYEEMLSDNQASWMRICGFIGISPAAPIDGTLKQRRIPLSRAISNFKDLSESLRGTQYEAWLND